MVAICACALASKLYPTLDIGKVAQFATIHDLVEVYAGDTNTFNISHEDRKEKEKREELAYERIHKEFGEVYPWIGITIKEYESLISDEAQFVKVVDKVMTKLTHRINHGAYLKHEGKTKEETAHHYETQTQAIEEKWGAKFPEVIVILKQLTSDILSETYASPHVTSPPY
jgi:5'-deoxynucleotidase YfbR-like HD superfamily hydrolase